MAEELQHLIDRIQKEAVDTGEKQAAQIVSQAKEKAAAIVKEAEDKSRALIEKAEKDAALFTERSMQTLSQAARDLLITVGQGVENIVANLAAEASDEALTIDVVQQMLVKMAEAYIKAGDRDRHIELLLSPEDQAQLVKFFKGRYHDALTKGVEIRADSQILKGFKVSMVDDHVYHDFTNEAIAEALTNFLRPHLADIVNKVAREKKAAAQESKRP